MFGCDFDLFSQIILRPNEVIQSIRFHAFILTVYLNPRINGYGLLLVPYTRFGTFKRNRSLFDLDKVWSVCRFADHVKMNTNAQLIYILWANIENFVELQVVSLSKRKLDAQIEF